MVALSATLIFLVSLLFLLPVIAFCLGFPYVALRVRDSREPKKDPELGIKSAYYMLMSASIILAVVGLTISALDLMDGAFEKGDNKGGKEAKRNAIAFVFGEAKKDEKEGFLNNPVQRIALSLVVSGLLFSLTFMILLRAGTNDSTFPAARRSFLGARLGIFGTVVLIAVTALIVLFFQKDVKVMAPYEVLTAILLIWLPGFILHIVLMRLQSSKPYCYDTAAAGASGRRFVDDD
jgi:hypothetical protein